MYKNICNSSMINERQALIIMINTMINTIFPINRHGSINVIILTVNSANTDVGITVKRKQISLLANKT